MTNGYAFIKLPQKLVELIDECINPINSFFNNYQQTKKMYYRKPIFGYFNADHKESFRFLTGTRLQEHVLPNNFKSITNLIKLMDKLMLEITHILAPHIFPLLNNQQNIPLLGNNANNKWAMFDITKYYNNGTRLGQNCKEHIDPGLISLSIRSTTEGLQLKDQDGNWIKPPVDNNIGILWLGQAAVKINPKLKAGTHRVVNTLTPRIAMWYEVCTLEQEHTEIDTKKDIKVAKTMESVSGLSTSKTIGPIIKKLP